MFRSLDPLEWVVFGGPSSSTGGEGGPGTQIKTVKSILPHPSARGNKYTLENNIALIQLQVHLRRPGLKRKFLKMTTTKNKRKNGNCLMQMESNFYAISLKRPNITIF